MNILTVWRALALAALLCSSLGARAAPAEIVRLVEPERSIAIHLGDVLQRQVEIAVEAPYQISRSAFPHKGERQNDIELADIEIVRSAASGRTVYRITLRYQVFAYATRPQVMQLPATSFAVTGGPEAVTVSLPPRGFWYAPLAQANVKQVEGYLQPQYRTPLLDDSAPRRGLLISGALLLIGLIGLVYVNFDRRWLPWMGGAFARAHRRLKALVKNRGTAQQGLLAMHQAFNQVHGATLFAADVDAFLARHPGFARCRAEIDAFFEQSGKILYAHQADDQAALLRRLVLLSRQLRDCERRVA